MPFKRPYSNLAGEFAAEAGSALGKAAFKAMSANKSKTSTAVVTNQLGTAFSNAEGAERRRLPPAKYRLHDAKWLVMDKMLKNMFFPLQTSTLDFGISSFSGVGNDNMSDVLGAPNTSINFARTRGLHRGLALFNLRITNDDASRTGTNYLNSAYIDVGHVEVGTGTPTIYSPYRRFHNQPILQAGSSSDAGEIVQHNCQELDTADVVDVTKMRSLDVGLTLAQMESVAAASMVYADPVFNYHQQRSIASGGGITSDIVRGETSVIAGEGQSAHPEAFTNSSGDVTSVNWLNSTNTLTIGDGGPCYLGAVQDAVMRIVDGHVVMDIMNTEQTPTVVEIVIHSKKKNNLTKQEVYNSIFNDVERKVRRVNPGNGDLSAQPPLTGGWQAFYDPEYPLLRIPAGGNALNYVTEVHRSHHVLLPGQSKEVKISLGSLYYKIKNKNDVVIQEETPNQIFTKFKDNVGSLYCAIGHSGFSYPQTGIGMQSGSTVIPSMTTPSTSMDQFPQGNIAGTGFWVGRSRSPSSINVHCKYVEKYYPLTFDRSNNGILASNSMARPTYLSGGIIGDLTPALPIATIASERVATDQSDIIQPLSKGSFSSEL